MPDLIHYQAKLCATTCGFLIHDHKILLVFHKKLHIWLAPGGHLETGELPHQGAQREVYEETGIKVKAVSTYTTLKGIDSQYLPMPFAINLHWISEERYEARLGSSHPQQRLTSKIWPKGCEQHYAYLYLVKPVSDVRLHQNEEETDAIRWFLPEEIKDLITTADIKQEVALAFKLTS